MPAVTLPPGIGNDQQAQQATAFIRQQPWYAQLLQSWGFPASAAKGDANGNPPKLSESQQAQLLQTAQQHGIGISDKYHVDENGQIAAVPSHVWRNIGIGAAVAGLALTGLGAAGIGPLAGAFGAGASGAIPAAFGSTAVDTVASAAPALAGAAAPAAAAALGPMAGGETGMAATTAALGGLTPPASLGAVYSGVPTAAAASAGGKAVSAFTTPNIWSSILSNGFQLGGALLSSSAAKDAAKIQADSANKAALLAYQAQQNSLAFQQQEWAAQQQNMAPWLKAGQGAVNTLGTLFAGRPSTGTTAPAGARPPMAAPAPGTMSAIYGGAGAPTRSASAAPDYARIKWPDGSTDTVSSDSLAQYRLLGAEAV